MEVRLGAEVGLKNHHAYTSPKTDKPPVENVAQLPGDDMNNRNLKESKEASQALRPTDMKQRFQSLGNTINMQA